jgi:hypothetical protein
MGGGREHGRTEEGTTREQKGNYNKCFLFTGQERKNIFNCIKLGHVEILGDKQKG